MDSQSTRAGLIASAGLMLLVVAVYLPVRSHQFLGFDDPLYVTQNPMVQGGLSWAGFRWAFQTFYASNWHPLTWLSHMLDVELLGLQAGAHHLMNVLLHSVNTVCFYLLIRSGTRQNLAALVCAAVFAVHPLRVESVAWVSERKDLLSGLFGLIAMLLYVRFHQSGRRGIPWRSVLAFALALMSKPMLVTLPFVLVLLDWWFLNRWGFSELAQWSRDETLRKKFVSLVVEKWPYLLLTIASCILTIVAQSGEISAMEEVSIGFRIQNAIVSYGRYLLMTLWPVNLAALYPLPLSWPVWIVAGSLLLLAGISIAVLRCAKSDASLAVGWFWFLGAAVPVIGLVQVGNQAMADRYTYFPHMGLIAGTVCWLWPRVQAGKYVVSILIVLGCALATSARIPYWRDTLTLHTRTLEVTRDNYVTQTFVGYWLVEQDRMSEARPFFEEALRIRPEFVGVQKVHRYLGTILALEGRHREALAHFQEALKRSPNDAASHNNLGGSYRYLRDLESAEKCYRRALTLDPESDQARVNLALTLQEMGKQDEATKCFLESAQRGSTNYVVYYHLGWAAGARNDWPAAQSFLSVALNVKPTDEASLHLMGKVHERMGDAGSALLFYQRSLAAHPGSANSLLALASFRARCPRRDLRDYREAVLLADRARQIPGPHLLPTLEIMETCYTELGRPEEARATVLKGLEIAPANSEWHRLFQARLRQLDSRPSNLR